MALPKTKNVRQSGLEKFYAPFSRVDEESREVEGYCYTSGRVPGDRWNLTRGALERSTAKYMEMPAVRAMHQPIAAGKGLSVIFDDHGAKILCRIVDDNEWNKVREGVYRGFSIQGRPIIARGTDIEEFEWVETSLVDRPKDPGALFTTVRAVGIDDTDAEYDVQVISDEGDQSMKPNTAATDSTTDESARADVTTEASGVERVQTSDKVPARENLEGDDDKDDADTEDDATADSADSTDDSASDDAAETADAATSDSDDDEDDEDDADKKASARADVAESAKTADGVTRKKGDLSTFNDSMASIATAQLSGAVDILMSSMYSSVYGAYAGSQGACLQSVSEFSKWLTQWVKDNVPADDSPDTARSQTVADELNKVSRMVSGAANDERTHLLARVEGLDGEVKRLAVNLSKAETDLELTRGQLSESEGEVKRLRDMPLEATKPVKFSAVPLDREFTVNRLLDADGGSPAEARQKLQERKDVLMKRAQSGDVGSDERNTIANEIATIDVWLNRSL